MIKEPALSKDICLSFGSTKPTSKGVSKMVILDNFSCSKPPYIIAYLFFQLF